MRPPQPATRTPANFTTSFHPVHAVHPAFLPATSPGYVGPDERCHRRFRTKWKRPPAVRRTAVRSTARCRCKKPQQPGSRPPGPYAITSPPPAARRTRRCKKPQQPGNRFPNLAVRRTARRRPPLRLGWSHGPRQPGHSPSCSSCPLPSLSPLQKGANSRNQPTPPPSASSPDSVHLWEKAWFQAHIPFRRLKSRIFIGFPLLRVRATLNARPCQHH